MEFSEVIEKRHSVRKYTEQPVDREILDTLVSIAQTAPSSKNCRSSAFMIVDDSDTLTALSEMRESGSAFLKNAPAAIVVLGDETKTDLWVENSCISATFLQLAATAMDLGSCWIHVDKRPRSKTDASKGSAESYVRELLGLKDGIRVLCVVSVGYEDVQ